MTAFAGRIPLRGGALPAFGERRGCAGAELSVAIAGTLDNARDLRRDLEAAGHECAAGDADVVAHAYECWGVACVERIEGPVAIAIHDPRNSLCLLSRDRAGFASVAYHVSPEAIAFGSSVGGVAALAGIAREVDPQAIDAYLSIGAVPAPASIYRGVRKLQPAHVLVATREGTHEVRRYFSFVPGTGWPGTEVATGRMAALLEDAVARAMERGDAGLLLSAGPDSAIVLASAASRGRPLPSFTFGFTGGYAEIDQAHRTADHFGVPHEAFRLEPRIAEILPAVVRGHDEPHGNPSALLWHHIKAETGKRVGTILSGDGADELFSGRDVHMVAGPAETVHRTVPAPLLAAGARAAGKRPMAEKFFRGAALPVQGARQLDERLPAAPALGALHAGPRIRCRDGSSLRGPAAAAVARPSSSAPSLLGVGLWIQCSSPPCARPGLRCACLSSTTAWWRSRAVPAPRAGRMGIFEALPATRLRGTPAGVAPGEAAQGRHEDPGGPPAQGRSAAPVRGNGALEAGDRTRLVRSGRRPPSPR
ncbi:MAG: asparagine synthase-related protein [Acidobacteriota bacterium]